MNTHNTMSMERETEEKTHIDQVNDAVEAAIADSHSLFGFGCRDILTEEEIQAVEGELERRMISGSSSPSDIADYFRLFEQIGRSLPKYALKKRRCVFGR